MPAVPGKQFPAGGTADPRQAVAAARLAGAVGLGSARGRARRRPATCSPETPPETPPESPTRVPESPPESEEAAIAGAGLQASWAYAEDFLDEDDVLAGARARAEELGCVPVGPGVGAALRMLASAAGARAVVEVGTGTGVSGLWLLRGMRPDGVLTTVDVEPEHQRAAKDAFAEAGVMPNRARLIGGRALDVLPRLTDGAYDLVFCDGDQGENATYLEEALRLLRPGGVVAFDDALWHHRVPDPAQRDPETVSIRELGRTVRGDERLLPCLLPVGDGLLVGVKR